MSDGDEEYHYDPDTPQGRRRFITHTVGHFIGRGISKTATLSWFRKVGYGVARDTFSTLWENAKGLIERSSRIQSVRPRDFIQDSVFEPSDRDFGSRYRYIVSYLTYDKDGFVTKKYLTADTNVIGTKAQVEQTLMNTFFADENPYDTPISGVQIERGYINKDR